MEVSHIDNGKWNNLTLKIFEMISKGHYLSLEGDTCQSPVLFFESFKSITLGLAAMASNPLAMASTKYHLSSAHLSKTRISKHKDFRPLCYCKTEGAIQSQGYRYFMIIPINQRPSSYTLFWPRRLSHVAPRALGCGRAACQSLAYAAGLNALTRPLQHVTLVGVLERRWWVLMCGKKSI